MIPSELAARRGLALRAKRYASRYENESPVRRQGNVRESPQRELAGRLTGFFPAVGRIWAVTRVLVVEDERAVRDALERVLRTDGYEVELACDGAAALAAVSACAPDAIVLDEPDRVPRRLGLVGS